MWLREVTIATSLLLTAGCATPSAIAPGLPGDLIRNDEGTLSGVWRDRRGLVLTINLHTATFAAQKGCTISGGVLVPLGQDRFRIDRYESGYLTDDCGPWRSGPAIAPFDGEDVALVRNGDRLLATGGGASITLDRLKR